jgi:hypothetical protein
MRGKTIAAKDLLKQNRQNDSEETYPEWIQRPRTRAECVDEPRPCPFISCTHHLYLDVNAETGAVKMNFPDVAVEDMAESCVLDVADRGGVTLEEVGRIMNLTRERIRQIEMHGTAKLKERIPHRPCVMCEERATDDASGLCDECSDS